MRASLETYGGIAVDFKVWLKKSQRWMPAHTVIVFAGRHFDYVKAYDDGHVHGDMRIVWEEEQNG